MSDYDRSKFYGKKKFSNQNKEASSSSNFGRSYYGRRSPSGSFSKYEKDTPKEVTPTKSETKIKQPTILLKAREHSEDVAVSPKRAQKEHDLSSSITITASSTTTTTTTTEAQPPPNVKPMTKSVKFLEDSIVFSENIQEYLLENNDFLVVGLVGPQSSGKSTIANLIAHSSLTDNLKKALFKADTGSNEETYGNDVKVLSENLDDLKINNATNIKCEIFKIQGTEETENNANTTRGIDMFVTSNRVILLDCQPFISLSVLDDLVQSENKRSNIVSEFIPLENSSEIQNLQLTAFLMSVCHILIVVQDWFFDSNVVRFIQTAEMLKPTHSNPEDELNDHFPHLLLIQNKAQMEDFSPRKFTTMQKIYSILFDKSKLQRHSNLGLATSRLITCIDETCGDPFNLFLIPEFNPKSNEIYSGHPALDELIRKMRASILGAIKTSLTHVPLTEKTWLLYCSKVWENVRKSSFFVEYTKLMP